MSRKILLAFQSLILICAASVVNFSQDRSQTPKPASSSRREVPEAVLPTTPEETAWWEKLRTAGDTVRKNRGRKGSQDFLGLLQEGHDHSYQVPIADSKPIVLSMTQPQYTESARAARISGAVQLRVEFRSDGLVGEVEVTEGLRSDLDEKAIEAARRTMFLPAIKDRQFQTDTRMMVMSFHIY